MEVMDMSFANQYPAPVRLAEDAATMDPLHDPLRNMSRIELEH